MLARKPQTVFLLRASALLLGLLVLWWLVLREPMLFLLKESARACGGFLTGVPAEQFVSEAPNGDWTFKVPMDFTASPNPGGQLMHFHSVDFDMAHADVSTFTFSLPVYWAIVLAAPWAGRTRRAVMQALIHGTLYMSLTEIALLLILVEIFAHKTVAQLVGTPYGAGSWLVRLGEYVVVEVLPYLIPVVMALWLHAGVREQVFPASASGKASTVSEATSA